MLSLPGACLLRVLANAKIYDKRLVIVTPRHTLLTRTRNITLSHVPDRVVFNCLSLTISCLPILTSKVWYSWEGVFFYRIIILLTLAKLAIR